ncbi:MAG: hypothetical protein AAF945_06030 [Actinomycetota bacterium]
MTDRLSLPDLGPAESFVRSSADPVVAHLVATRLDRSDGRSTVAPAVAHPPVADLLRSQRSDGSWGDRDDPPTRVLGTLWSAKVLVDVGLGRLDAVGDGVDFLHRHATCDPGVFSLDGTRRGVLSCYVGTAGSIAVAADRPDLADEQIRWILQHQEVRRSGRSLRSSPTDVWSPELATRYGGCLSETTCLVGLVRTGAALADQRDRDVDAGAGDDPEVAAMLTSIRDAFLEREVIRASSGAVVPVGSPAGDPERWLDPGFPLDWHVDLVEVLDLLGRIGPADARIQPAIDALVERRLADGTWPLRRSHRPGDLKAFGRRSSTRGSALATVRVVSALRRFDAPDASPAR